MNVEVAANKRFLDTSATQSARDWDELLVSQVDLSIANELGMLLSLDKWNRSEAVIDAGCGNGYYLAALRSFFPEKRFLGVDISPELIAAASHRHPEIEFQQADFFALQAEPADVLMMRFIVQHLGDFRSILRQASRVLRPDGALIIVEADLARSLVRPLPTAFHGMLETYAAVSTNDGGLKTRLLSDPEGLVADSGEPWRLAEIRDSATAMVGPFVGGNLATVFGKWVDLAERSAMFAFDFEAVRTELQEWSTLPASFVNLVTRMFVFEQIRPT